MNLEQVRVVAEVYRQFMASEESRGWEPIDDYLDFLEYLDNDQLHREADVILEQHKGLNVKCEKDHPQVECLVPKLLEAAAAILDLYRETGELHKKNKYILQYYLACNQAGMIKVY
jgi:hypothetical protein